MKRRRLGTDGPLVSAVGLGGNNFGRAGSATAGVEGTRDVLHAALDAGVTFVDTAEMYGTHPGQSEELIGEAVAGRRDEMVIATKFGHPALLMPGLEHLRPGGAEYIRGALEGSLRRLRTDRIDLYQMHAPDPATPIDETVAVLAGLVDEGLILAFGFSNFSPEQLRAAPAGAVSVQDDYSLLRRDAERELLPAARELGISFLPYYPLFNGLLTGKFTRDDRPGDTRLARQKPELLESAPWDVLEEYAAFCATRGITMLEATFGWMLAQHPIASVIAGATTPEQVRANAAAGEWEPTADDVAAISAIFDR